MHPGPKEEEPQIDCDLGQSDKFWDRVGHPSFPIGRRREKKLEREEFMKGRIEVG